MLILLFIGGCGTTGKLVKPQKVEHVYLEPTTNFTSEEGLDVLLTKVADWVFYSDPRFKVDLKPAPDRTLIIKPVATSISTTPVGYDKNDVAREYRLSITVKVKMTKFGFRKPLYTFTITRYDFYDGYGTPSEIEEKRKECIKRVGEEIFREVGERLLVEGSSKVHRQ